MKTLLSLGFAVLFASIAPPMQSPLVQGVWERLRTSARPFQSSLS
jgi:hypothetical protein